MAVWSPALRGLWVEPRCGSQCRLHPPGAPAVFPSQLWTRIDQRNYLVLHTLGYGEDHIVRMNESSWVTHFSRPTVWKHWPQCEGGGMLGDSSKYTADLQMNTSSHRVKLWPVLGQHLPRGVHGDDIMTWATEVTFSPHPGREGLWGHVTWMLLRKKYVDQ